MRFMGWSFQKTIGRHVWLRQLSRSARAKELAVAKKAPPSFTRDGNEYTPMLLHALKRLDRLVDWERQARTVGENRLMRVSSSPCASLLKLLGEPQRSLRSIHVTGSKGKGSVVALVAAALEREGFRTGCFCSPHVQRINERVIIDLQEVHDDVLAEALERTLDLRERHKLTSSTWFDVLTASALRLLADAGVDWAVVEVGLGGRLDSTNVLNAEVCVITNVMLEHEAIIGPTRVDIAREKAGIVSLKGGAVITGVQPADAEVFAEIQKAVKEAGAEEPYIVPQSPDSTWQTNVNIAGAVLDKLGSREIVSKRRKKPLVREHVDRDVQETARAMLKGRMEPFHLNGTLIVVDGAHVGESVLAAIRDTEKQFGSPPSYVVVSAPNPA